MSKTARNSLKLSLFTVISRVLGLLRDHYQAVFFGTGSIATSWEIAYMLPNMLRNLLAEGVLSQSFIPVYSDALKKSEKEAKRVAGVIIFFLAVFLTVLVAAGILLFPYFIPIYTGKSFSDSQLTVELAQIMFVFIMTTSLTAIFAGISNTHNLFTVPALSPVFLNLVFIGSFIFLQYADYGDELNVSVLAWSVVAGGILQLGIQMFYVYKSGSSPQYSFSLTDPSLRKIFTLMAPAVLGAGLFQFNQLMDIALASYFIPGDVGAVPALRYAHRLIQLPTGVIGVALSTAILPALAAAIRSGKENENGDELVSAVSFAFFLTAPAGLGLYLLGPQIIDLLFYGGAWNVKSSQETWYALQFYCIGIPFYSANKILTSSYYAYQDTRTPIRILIGTVAVNLLLNLILIHYLMQGALALSTSISAVLNFILLYYFMRTKMEGIFFLKLLIRIRGQIAAWAVLALYIILIKYFFTEELRHAGRFIASIAGSHVIPRYEALSIVIVDMGGSMILYFLVSYYSGNKELEVFKSLKKKFTK